ncbi:TPA: hypothetical protein NJ263_004600 [Vibrio parahaemolyticus]|nr:hypothetical protein [Vibrio parahaemolyticus]
MNKMEKIFLCDEYSIFRHVPDEPVKDTVVICFDEINGGLNSKGFGTEFLIKNGIESFFISHAKMSFFQGLSEESLLHHLSEYLKDKKVFTFGASLGGYAALYYSDVLNAKAIAFSPRCSVDPLYQNSESFGVVYKHQIMSEKKLINKISPVVIVDPTVPKDEKFLEKRILPIYQQNINLVKLIGGTHYTAKAMLSQGLLKNFVLNVIHHDLIECDGFNALENATSLSSMALVASQTNQFDNANAYLKKLNSLNKEPTAGMRIQAYLTLVKKGKLAHKFSKNDILPSEKRSVYNKSFRKLNQVNRPRELLLLQAKICVDLLDFKRAIEIIDELIVLYPTNKEINSTLDKYREYYRHAENWIF